VPPWACLPGWRLGPLHKVLPRLWVMAILEYLEKSKQVIAGKNILRDP
jgi:hypothetical protein